MEATKTVEGAFGPKQMSKVDFVERWSDHFGQIYLLADTTAEYEELQKMVARVKVLAEQAWERIPAQRKAV